jgi:hypothetical protein
MEHDMHDSKYATKGARKWCWQHQLWRLIRRVLHCYQKAISVGSCHVPGPRFGKTENTQMLDEWNGRCTAFKNYLEHMCRSYTSLAMQ